MNQNNKQEAIHACKRQQFYLYQLLYAKKKRNGFSIAEVQQWIRASQFQQSLIEANGNVEEAKREFLRKVGL